MIGTHAFEGHIKCICYSNEAKYSSLSINAHCTSFTRHCNCYFTVNGDKYNKINSLLVTDVQKSTMTTYLVTANNYLIVDQGNWPSLLCF